MGRAFRSWKEFKEREKHVILYYIEWEILGKDQFLLEEAAPDTDEGSIDTVAAGIGADGTDGTQ